MQATLLSQRECKYRRKSPKETLPKGSESSILLTSSNRVLEKKGRLKKEHSTSLRSPSAPCARVVVGRQCQTIRHDCQTENATIIRFTRAEPLNFKNHKDNTHE